MFDHTVRVDSALILYDPPKGRYGTRLECYVEGSTRERVLKRPDGVLTFVGQMFPIEEGTEGRLTVDSMLTLVKDRPKGIGNGAPVFVSAWHNVRDILGGKYERVYVTTGYKDSACKHEVKIKLLAHSAGYDQAFFHLVKPNGDSIQDYSAHFQCGKPLHVKHLSTALSYVYSIDMDTVPGEIRYYRSSTFLTRWAPLKVSHQAWTEAGSSGGPIIIGGAVVGIHSMSYKPNDEVGINFANALLSPSLIPILTPNKEYLEEESVEHEYDEFSKEERRIQREIYYHLKEAGDDYRRQWWDEEKGPQMTAREVARIAGNERYLEIEGRLGQDKHRLDIVGDDEGMARLGRIYRDLKYELDESRETRETEEEFEERMASKWNTKRQGFDFQDHYAPKAEGWSRVGKRGRADEYSQVNNYFDLREKYLRAKEESNNNAVEQMFKRYLAENDKLSERLNKLEEESVKLKPADKVRFESVSTENVSSVVAAEPEKSVDNSEPEPVRDPVNGVADEPEISPEDMLHRALTALGVDDPSATPETKERNRKILARALNKCSGPGQTASSKTTTGVKQKSEKSTHSSPKISAKSETPSLVLKTQPKAKQSVSFSNKEEESKHAVLVERAKAAQRLLSEHLKRTSSQGGVSQTGTQKPSSNPSKSKQKT